MNIFRTLLPSLHALSLPDKRTKLFVQVPILFAVDARAVAYLRVYCTTYFFTHSAALIPRPPQERFVYKSFKKK